MTALRDLISQHPAESLALGGLVIGLAFGAMVQAANFCAMGAVSDMVTFGDGRRFRAWLLAVATAILGAGALDHAGVVSLASSMYLAPRLNWAGHIVGGLMFGLGMVLAGGCASRNLVRAGAGDLRSLLTLLVLGLFAYMALGGVLGSTRAAFESATAVPLASPTQSIVDLTGGLTGFDRASVAVLLPVAIGACLAAVCFANTAFRTSPLHMLAGLGVGLAVVAGWALTGLAFDEMASKPLSPVSLSFVKPTGDTIEWLQRQTALGLPGFGVATVIGTLIGSAGTALLRGRFELMTFAGTADTLRHLAGAALMGTGGVMALGCSIGQGITGLSTLALGSVLAFASILSGTFLGLKALERWAT